MHAKSMTMGFIHDHEVLFRDQGLGGLKELGLHGAKGTVRSHGTQGVH